MRSTFINYKQIIGYCEKSSSDSYNIPGQDAYNFCATEIINLRLLSLLARYAC